MWEVPTVYIISNWVIFEGFHSASTILDSNASDRPYTERDQREISPLISMFIIGEVIRTRYGRRMEN